MQILTLNKVVFGRFKVLSFPKGSGQSFNYHAIDTQAPETKPWLREVFLKQFNDLIPGTEEADALKMHYSALRVRLGEKANFICLPLHLGQEANSIIAVYPWVQGMTLQDRMVEGLRQNECVRIALALSNAVRMMHSQNIAHLDLKPANIIVYTSRRDGKIYIQIIDLDSAQIDGEGLRRKVMGTEYYMSTEHCFPELFGNVSIKSDVFTLGVMLFELLFKQHPFFDTSNYRQAIIDESYIIPESKYHRDVVDVILQCLHAEPFKRPNAGWVLHMLMNYYKTNLEAAHPSERYISTNRTRIYVQLDSHDDAGNSNMPRFRRTYYETVDLDHRQLRGAKIGAITGVFLRLVLDAQGCLLIVLDDSVEISIEGKRLRRGDSTRLASRQSIKIGSQSFDINTKRY